MTAELNSAEKQARPEGHGSSQHDIERAVARLNTWFTENKHRIPRCWNWRRFRWQRTIPVFKAVRTTAIKGWNVHDLNRLFRVVRTEGGADEGELEVAIELLVVDKSLRGAFLNVPDLMEAAFDVIAARHLLGKFSPRLMWFWSHYPSLVLELESYVSEIRLRVDAATPIQHDQRRVFEEFSVPLKQGQQTALGNNCMFILDYMQPQGAVSYWRFSITQHGEVLVGPLVLQTKPIYHQDQLLAVIKSIGDTTVTLSVLSSEGG